MSRWALIALGCAGFAAALVTAVALDAQSPDSLARAVLRATPLVDGHNDLPWTIRTDRAAHGDPRAYRLRERTRGSTDVDRLRAGLLGAQLWSVYVPCETVAAKTAARTEREQIALARALVGSYPEVLGFAGSAAELESVFRGGRIASLLAMEGGHAIEDSLDTLRSFYALGVRSMALTHSCTNDWADAATDRARHGGLSPFGVEVVREMNRLGMLVDLAHAAPATMLDALDASEAPVIWSHAGARGLVDHPRNVPDDVLRRLPENGGLVMVAFVPAFVSREARAWELRELAERRRLAAEQASGGGAGGTAAALAAWRRANPPPAATLRDVADQIDHVRSVAGVEHVGIGSDFEGSPWAVRGLQDVASYPALFAELARRGWTADDLSKLAGGNFLRVFRAAEDTAARLQRERPPSRATLAIPGSGARR